MTLKHDVPARGPLILGAGGRIGRAFRVLAEGGHWPVAERPLWHGRRGADYSWDMLAEPPPRDDRLSDVSGMIVLAGGRSGGDIAPQEAAALARAALDLALREGIGPVLLCSSQAVYGPTAGPHSEVGPTAAHTAYGEAKLAMENAAGVDACCLRIGNVAGCDMLLMNAAKGRVTLDRFPDGQSPRRCYIGPVSLARIMIGLLDGGRSLPAALNLAAPGTVSMSDLLEAASLDFDWRPAPAGALPDLRLDLSRLAGLVPLDPDWGQAETLIAEARLAGWAPAS
ncbi:NAD-dependent epimerase/dehydratase family protein [Ponticoccus sp. SC2-23]|uniref:NAD-dependent epimerase/dehydratase family protein n=1 Tax=Alexandriicola marinus TaxID=2081710 RepID=UPI0013E037AF|nr:NAD-dependent epimerase/dehydratase family protein [Alexandriicola marinus]MBM1222186.1 NAD-dependent epimerase/dehydratase family protein [Ponticoccus sp. SC6-9]MBM1226873.1 NAD-dependent epimerase/dehydratase family protein [Ponticoccus sp. SC6-15]MBM1235615.1 NAD-dependent epimerase/dehydratase family protein [Ponticoccus sp. SC6-45]MBM1240155.1 NAD-dependent epimerase/dehydratase family protein [Ponticoccus sp. SC6-49]MBM1244509.1 NAD-dependent epimerase/dehydratase family protein [Pont